MASNALTPTQRRMLEGACRGDQRVMHDGNATRTARSLVRRGLAKWWPEGTRVALEATEAGRRVIERCS